MKLSACIVTIICLFGMQIPFDKPLKYVNVKTECTGCRKALKDADYKQKIHIAKNNLGYVRVRKDASCFEVAECKTNLIDSIPDNTWVYAMGPVKNADFSAGIAFIIKIKDKTGKFYNGYLSYTVLDSINNFPK